MVRQNQVVPAFIPALRHWPDRRGGVSDLPDLEMGIAMTGYFPALPQTKCQDYRPSTGLLASARVCSHWWGQDTPGNFCERGLFCQWAGRPPEGEEDGR